jgi:hypothetical protein
MWGVVNRFCIVFLGADWYRHQTGIQMILKCCFAVILNSKHRLEIRQI